MIDGVEAVDNDIIGIFGVIDSQLAIVHVDPYYFPSGQSWEIPSRIGFSIVATVNDTVQHDYPADGVQLDTVCKCLPRRVTYHTVCN